MKKIITFQIIIPILLLAQTIENLSIESSINIINTFNEDDRVLLTIDSLEKADEFLDKLKISGHNQEYRLPKTGMDFVFIYFRIDEKVDLKIGLSELRLNKSNVICDNNKYYTAIEQHYKSVFSKNKQGFIIFELPKNINPTELRYFYQYRDDNKPKRKIKIGQIDITLINDEDKND